MPVLHDFVNPVADESGFAGTKPSDWNAPHDVSIENADVAANAGIVESKLSLNFPTHAAVTLGTPNGLSLSGQQISMGLAGANSTGTLSAQDWNIFNNKQSSLSFPLIPAQGGTGVINTGTFTNQNNTSILGGGTLNLGGYTLSIPTGGVAALLAVNNIFTRGQMIDGSQNEIQLRVQGHNTQTNYLQTWENVTGTVHAFIQNNGWFQDYGHVAFGANSNVNNPGQTHYPGYVFDVPLSVETIVSPSNAVVDFYEGAHSYLTVNPSVSDLVTSYFGLDGQAWTEVGNTKNINYVTGIYGSAVHQGTGHLNYLNGLEYFAGTGGDGDIGRLIGVHSAIDHYYAGTIDEFIGAKIEAYWGGTIGTRSIGVWVINAEDGGTSPEAYGILIDDVTGATTNYSLYSGAGAFSIGGNLFLRTIKSGATQVGAGASANEVWKTNGHATLPNNVLMIGI